jgi:hypothetical protein
MLTAAITICWPSFMTLIGLSTDVVFVDCPAIASVAIRLTVSGGSADGLRRFLERYFACSCASTLQAPSAQCA